MFQIHNGGTTFKQWTKGNKLIMDVLPVGADVLFYNETYSDAPLKSDVYEITVDDETIKVCDVPSVLLTKAEKIKVCVGSVVTGKYGVNHSMVGPREKYFEVEPADRPSDYVEDPVDTGGGLTKLPEGYPYKEQSETVLRAERTLSCKIVNGVSIAEEGPDTIEEGKQYAVYINGNKSICTGAYMEEGIGNYCGNIALFAKGLGMSESEAASMGFANTGENYLVCLASNGVPNVIIDGEVSEITFAFSEYSETIHPIAPEFLPEGYPYKETAIETIISEQNVTGFIQSQDPLYVVNNPFSITLIPGNSYTVVWDGTAYECVAHEQESSGYKYIGNANYVNMQGGGDIPFAIIYAMGMTAVVIESTYEEYESESHNVSISGMVETIHPMAPEFLPAGVGRGTMVVNVVDGVVSHTAAEIMEYVMNGGIPFLRISAEGAVLCFPFTGMAGISVTFGGFYPGNYREIHIFTIADHEGETLFIEQSGTITMDKDFSQVT